MPALPTVVTDYLTAIKDALTVGSDLGSNLNAAAQNYLRAMDMASVLDLLQDGLDTGTLTATGGTASSVQDTGAFGADEQVGNVVTFTGNVTAALAGVAARVTSNTANELFFNSLPDTPAVGDTFTVAGGLMDAAIEALREGHGLADSPRGSVYGDARLVSDALTRSIIQLGGTTPARNVGWTSLETAAGSTDTVIVLNTADSGTFRVDEMRGFNVDISGEERRVLRNDESTLTMTAPFSSAPSAATAVAVYVGEYDISYAGSLGRVHPGRQNGENAMLAELIDVLEATVVAFTTPT